MKVNLCQHPQQIAIGCTSIKTNTNHKRRNSFDLCNTYTFLYFCIIRFENIEIRFKYTPLRHNLSYYTSFFFLASNVVF